MIQSSHLVLRLLHRNDHIVVFSEKEVSGVFSIEYSPVEDPGSEFGEL